MTGEEVRPGHTLSPKYVSVGEAVISAAETALQNLLAVEDRIAAELSVPEELEQELVQAEYDFSILSAMTQALGLPNNLYREPSFEELSEPGELAESLIGLTIKEASRLRAIRQAEIRTNSRLPKNTKKTLIYIIDKGGEVHDDTDRKLSADEVILQDLGISMATWRYAMGLLRERKLIDVIRSSAQGRRISTIAVNRQALEADAAAGRLSDEVLAALESWPKDANGRASEKPRSASAVSEPEPRSVPTARPKPETALQNDDTKSGELTESETPEELYDTAGLDLGEASSEATLPADDLDARPTTRI